MKVIKPPNVVIFGSMKRSYLLNFSLTQHPCSPKEDGGQQVDGVLVAGVPELGRLGRELPHLFVVEELFEQG